MKKILILLFLLPIFCFSYDFDNGGVRSAALGFTGISSAKDASAAVWNPALLHQFNYFELITDTRPYFIQMDNDNIYQNFAYLAIPTRFFPGSFGLTGGLFNSNDFDEGRFGFHFGSKVFPKKLKNRFAAGISVYNYFVRYGGNTNENSNAIDLELGLHYNLDSLSNIGLKLRNIMQSDLGIEEPDKLPFSVGIGYNRYWRRFNFASDLSYFQNDKEFRLHLGSEYLLAENIILRAGMNNNYFTGGFGIDLFSQYWQDFKDQNYSPKFINIVLDYSFQYQLFAELDNDYFYLGNELESDFGDHFFGLKIDFGNSVQRENNFLSGFQSDLGRPLNVSIDTVFVEKVKIDTLVREKTIYDTIRIYEKVVDEQDIQDYLDAEKENIRRVEMQNVNQAAMHLNKALEHYYQEEYYLAITECEKAITIAPDFSLSYLRLASIYYRLGNMEEALHQLNIGLRIDPDNAELLKMKKMLIGE